MRLYKVRLKSAVAPADVEADNYTTGPNTDYHFFNVEEGKQIIVASFKFRDVIYVTSAPEIRIAKK